MKEYRNTTIKDWSVEDRPREKMLQYGVQSLSNAELLAILLGSGTRDMNAVDVARNMLSSVKNNLHDLAKLRLNELTSFRE